MPEVDGLEATRAIRQIEFDKHTRIPIIAMTAHAMAGDRERCIEAGMDDYLSKPIRIRALMQALGDNIQDSVIAQGDLTDDQHRQRAFVDWENAFETVGGDKSLLCELIQVFVEERENMIADIKSSLDKNDPAELRRSSHAMKGALGHLGAMSIASVAARMESIGEAGQTTGAMEDFESLDELTKQLTVELEAFTKDFNNKS